MRTLRSLGLIALAWTLGAVPYVPSGIDGFAPANVPIQRGYETAFLDVPSPQGILDELTRIDAEPHYAGSRGDYGLAVYMRDRLREFGLDAELEPFRTRVDRPRSLLLQLIVPQPQPTPVGKRRPRFAKPIVTTLDLRERGGGPADPVHGDPGLPFNAGSADGDVTAPLVYAHRGIDADYDRLADVGVDVRGAIVIVRYGAQFRGLLAERAQTRGALGVLFYDDPADDGAARGATYPDGPWRPSGAVQRGSVGDAVRIPTLPISADNARTLIAALAPVPLRRQAGGSAAANPPALWTGGLDVPYPYARGPALARLGVRLDRRITTLWNTVGRIRGTTDAEQTVVLGAHRDAWVRGVTDNGSGVTTMLEAARGFGYLLRSGWRPARTIVVAGWDGEEIGLRGSQAYVAAHRGELERGGVAYINADEAVAGRTFRAGAAGALALALIGTTRDVRDPILNRVSVRDRWGQGAPVDAPGGGSDHESFLTALGTPVAAFGFEGPLGTYHSVYDDLRYAKTIDPDMTMHRAMAQIDGVLALRLADADVLPYRFQPYVDAMQTQVNALGTAALDVDALRTAEAAFALAAAHADDAVARGRADPNDTAHAFTRRELAAARILDAYYYRIDGYRGTMLGALASAAADGDSARAQKAVAEATDVLTRAAAALTNS
jgi:N-acetylated-alpha-linked acidic dipeptidase